MNKELKELLLDKGFITYLHTQISIVSEYVANHLEHEPEKASIAIEVLRTILKKTFTGANTESERALCKEVYEKMMAEFRYLLIRKAVGEVYAQGT